MSRGGSVKPCPSSSTAKTWSFSASGKHRRVPPVQPRTQRGAAAVHQQQPVVGRVAGLDEMGLVAVDGLVVLLVLVRAVEQRLHLPTSSTPSR